MDLEKWMSALSKELGLTDLEITEDLVKTLLDVARDAAHEVERVAAPLTTFLVGVAVGRGATLAAAADATTTLLLDQPPPPPG
jgi:DNA-binding transcriptional regulator LsrR (DeoR family)